MHRHLRAYASFVGLSAILIFVIVNRVTERGARGLPESPTGVIRDAALQTDLAESAVPAELERKPLESAESERSADVSESDATRERVVPAPRRTSEPAMPGGADGPRHDRVLELLVRVLDEGLRPIDGATVEVNSSCHPSATVGATDARGECEFSLAVGGKDLVGQGIACVSAARFEVQVLVFRYTADDWADGSARCELEFVLPRGGSLNVKLVDEFGRPAPWAVVIARFQDRPDPAAGETRPGLRSTFRGEADREGALGFTGMALGRWTLQAVKWRDYEYAESVEILVDAVGRDVTLQVERQDPADYASGRFVDPRLSGDGATYGEFHLEEQSAREQICTIWNDGFFVVPAGLPPTNEEYDWLVIHKATGDECSAPVRLSPGNHQILLDSTCR